MKFTCKNKKAFLSKILILLAILLYEQYKHNTHASLCPNMQYLDDQQHVYQSFEVAYWFDSVCVKVARWVNLRHKCLLQHEQQLSDYNV